VTLDFKCFSCSFSKWWKSLCRRSDVISFEIANHHE